MCDREVGPSAGSYAQEWGPALHTEQQRQKHRQRERQAPLREADVGLDPGTPGLCPGPKAGTQLLSHPGVPYLLSFKNFCYMLSF